MIPIYVFGSWGRFGVAIFIILSAWFLVDKERDGHRGMKMVSISLTTIFYAMLIPAVFSIIGIKDVPITTYVKAIVSPFVDDYWFVSSYLVLLLFYPIINKLIRCLSGRELIYVVLVLVIISDVWGGILPSRVARVCGEFMTFLTLYFGVAYLKRNPDNWFTKKTGKKFILMVLLIIGLCIGCCALGTYTGIHALNSIPVRIVNNNSLLIDVTAVLFFYLFKKIKIKNINALNICAKTSLGVYVMHTVGVFALSGWDEYFHLGDMFLGKNIIAFSLQLIAASLIVFGICVILDLIRVCFIEKLFFKIGIVDKVVRKFDKLLNWYETEIAVQAADKSTSV